MKVYVSALLVALILASVHVDQSEAFLKKIGRFFKKVGGAVRDTACRVCPETCQLVPGGVGRVCSFACSAGCRNKRDLTAEQRNLGRHLVPLATSWASYDINEDNVISPEELAAATGVNKTDSGFLDAFKLADTNGDGVLSKTEFYRGPFVFEMDVSEEEYARCRYLLDKNGNSRNTGGREQGKVPPA